MLDRADDTLPGLAVFRSGVGRLTGATILLLGLAGSMAWAIDQPLIGTKLKIRDTGKKNVLLFISKDRGITRPLPGDAPTLLGASLEIINPTTGESQTFDLPAESWRVNRAGTVFRYVDRRSENGPVKSVILKNGKLLKAKAASTGITLNEPSQGVLLVRMAIGPRTFCALFDQASIRRDEPCVFLGRRAVAPTTCSSSAIGAFLAPSAGVK